MHDYAHPGTNNQHENAIASELALRYSDDTVLERHHCAAAFQVLRDPRFDVFSHLTTAERKKARALVIELVLNTDLKRHGKFIARQLKPLLPRGAKAWKARPPLMEDGQVITKTPRRSPLQEDQIDATFILNIAIKFADLGHVTKPFKMHRQWSLRATEEFWALGDREKALGVPVSALCDRDKDTDIAISQIGFFKFVCLPFFKPVFDLLDPDMPPAVHCRDNFWRWLAQKEARDTDASTRECPPAARAVAPPKPAARKRRASVAVLASSLTSMTRRLSGAPRLSAVGELQRPRS